MNQKFTPPPRIKTSLDNSKLRLSADTPGLPGKTANMTWGFVKNNPRITVWTGETDDSKKKIDIALDLPTLYTFFELIKKVVSNKLESKFKIENSNYTFFSGKRSENPKHINDLIVGRDKDGVIFVGVFEANKPAIKFLFKPSAFHNLYLDGNKLTTSEVSELYALAAVRLLEQMYSQIAVRDYVDDTKPNTFNQQSKISDQDIPF